MQVNVSGRCAMCVTVCACRRTRMATHLDGRHQRHEPRSRQRGPEHAVGVEADAHLARRPRAGALARGSRADRYGVGQSRDRTAYAGRNWTQRFGWLGRGKSTRSTPMRVPPRASRRPPPGLSLFARPAPWRGRLPDQRQLWSWPRWPLRSRPPSSL